MQQELLKQAIQISQKSKDTTPAKDQEEAKNDGGDPEMQEPEEQPESEQTQDQKNMQQAFQLKEEGNFFFKGKEYKKAIGKYCRINLYLKMILS